MDLVEFLRQQINIDERSFIEALFTVREDPDSVRSPGWCDAYCFLCDWSTTGYENVAEEAAYEHVSEKHRDHRSLREVEAKRAILADLEQVAAAVNRMEQGLAQSADEMGHPQAAWAAMRTLRNMALPYADHPDYHDEAAS